MKDILAYNVKDMKVKKVKTTKGSHDSELGPFAKASLISLGKLKWDLKFRR